MINVFYLNNCSTIGPLKICKHTFINFDMNSWTMEMGSYEILPSTICQVVLNCNHFIQLLALCRQGEIHDFFNTKCHIWYHGRKVHFQFFHHFCCSCTWQRSSLDESSCRTLFCKVNFDCIYLPSHLYACCNYKYKSCLIESFDLFKRNNKRRVK